MQLPRPLEHPALRTYLDDVLAWHGYIRFLGLPRFADYADVEINRLYVPPALVGRYVSPETKPADWPELLPALDAVGTAQRLVILGDPGSGKSTFVNWLAWLSAAGLTRDLPEWLTGALPLPLVLRELKLGAVKTFDDVVAAFLERPVAASLGNSMELLHQYLEDGRALVLVDGLDEIGEAARRTLQTALRAAWQQYPRSRWVLTSRIVGYDALPFDFDTLVERAQRDSQRKREGGGTTAADATADWLEAITEGVRIASALPVTPLATSGFSGIVASAAAAVTDRVSGMLAASARRAYVAPFDDARIEQFAAAWYRLRSSESVSRDTSRSFLGALRSSESAWQLARAPQLLTMMAQIYRVRLQLPDGRGLLYDDIAQAYLESIDQARGIADERFPWREKKRWLARVGFEMQLLRTGETALSEADTAAVDDEDSDERALLVGKGQVLAWIAAAMERSAYADPAEAGEFLNWVAQRSGLLVPRGEEQYAFVHLSFQEYFAAVHLVDRVRAPKGPEKSGVDRRALQRWAAATPWRETLVFAFELLASDPDWAADLSKQLFGAGAERIRRPAKAGPYDVYGTPVAGRAELLSRLVANPHSGLPAQERRAAVEQLVRFFNFDGNVEDRYVRALARLAGADISRRLLIDALERAQPHGLNLDAPSLTARDLAGLAPTLRTLYVRGRNDGVDALAGFRRLEALSLIGSTPEAIAAIARLPQLLTLSLWNDADQMVKLAPLRACEKLANLMLYGRGAAEIGELGHCAFLWANSVGSGPGWLELIFAADASFRQMHLDGCRIALDSSARFPALETLRIVAPEGVPDAWTRDAHPLLARCAALESLTVVGLEIENLDDLLALSKLDSLTLDHCDVKSVGSLRRHPALAQIAFTKCQVPGWRALVQDGRQVTFNGRKYG